MVIDSIDQSIHLLINFWSKYLFLLNILSTCEFLMHIHLILEKLIYIFWKNLFVFLINFWTTGRVSDRAAAGRGRASEGAAPAFTARGRGRSRSPARSKVGKDTSPSKRSVAKTPPSTPTVKLARHVRGATPTRQSSRHAEKYLVLYLILFFLSCKRMAECSRQLVLEPYLVLPSDVRSSCHYFWSLKIFFNSFSAPINHLPSCFVLCLSSCVCLKRLTLLTSVYCAFDMIQLKRYIIIIIINTYLKNYLDINACQTCIHCLPKG